MNVLVTGSTGFLGGWVVQALADKGCGVIGTRARKPDEWRTGMGCAGIEAVVHLAWYSSAGDGEPELQQRCLDDTRRLMRMFADAKPPRPRFIFASTASVYGGNGLPAPRETDWTSPQCAYTRAKATAEWSAQCILPDNHTIFRFGSLMGRGAPGCRTKTDLVVNAFAADAYVRGVVEVWAHAAVKPVLHVRDAAELIARACTEDGWHGVWNAHDGERRTAGQIAERVCELAGATVREVPDANGAAARGHSAPDTAKLRGNLESWWAFRKLEMAVREFAGYVPQPGDRNTPWR